MHLLADYWWAIPLLIVGIVLTFVLVAGRGAEGGFRGRTSHGWARWKAMSERVANVQARVLLSIFYFTLMAPFGVWQAFVSDRLVLRRPRGESFWVARTTRDRTLADGRKQF
jgi:hypothetical protein